MNELHDLIERKFVESFDVSEWEVKTHNGWADIKKSNKTIEYDVWRLETESGKWLECADTHIVFSPIQRKMGLTKPELIIDKEEVFVKDLVTGDEIIVDSDNSYGFDIDIVKSVVKLDRKEHMYDLTVGGDNTYFSNDILSHNTLILSNTAINAVKMGKNVLYISFEIDKRELRRRMDACFTDLNIRNLIEMRDEVKSRIKDARLNKNAGRFIIQEFPPSSVTCLDIENYIYQLQMKKEFVPDIIILDYLGIMKPINNSSTKNSYERGKEVCEELRSLSDKIKAPILSAVQTNRCLEINTLVVHNKKGNIKIKDVKVGDFIKTHNDFKRVKTVYPVTTQECYKLVTSGGSSIICSKKHIFPTDTIQKSLESGLQVGDKLLTRSYTQQQEEIESIEYVGEKETIDIEMDSDDRLFYANGILTHNSGYGHAEVELSNIADSVGIAQTCDLIISLAQDDEMKLNKQIKFEVIKSRISAKGGKGLVDISFDKMKLTSQEDIILSNKAVTSLAENISASKNTLTDKKIKKTIT